MKIQTILFCLIILSFGCNNDDGPAISNQAEQFLNEVLDTMEAYSIHRDKIDWTEFRAKVFNSVVGAQTIQDTYPGIKEALALLGDNHSRLVKPDGSVINVNTLKCDVQNITPPLLPENIGYVKVNSYLGLSDSDEAISYAEDILNQIRNQDNPDIIGWIVDLRSNRGGNMWPMLVGIGPILGEGTVGYFVDLDNYDEPWNYMNGSSILDGYTLTKLSNVYELMVPNPKVAVLLDNGVASSAEAIAISFIGRENTRSFGTSTCGLPTGIAGFPLNDNYELGLAISYMADRNKNVYKTSVNPDESVLDKDAVQKAIGWLEN